jgi:hypothetical protein
MTTNTTKIAEAIGLLSEVLSNEVAESKHFIDEDDDDDDFVSVEEYDELKEAVTDALPSTLTDIDGLKNDITCVVDVSDDDIDCSWYGEDDDDENEDSAEGGATDETKAEPTAEEKIEALETAAAELGRSNEQLTDLLESVFEGLEELENSLTQLQDDVESK